jgi:hypothetical protein
MLRRQEPGVASQRKAPCLIGADARIPVDCRLDDVRRRCAIEWEGELSRSQLGYEQLGLHTGKGQPDAVIDAEWMRGKVIDPIGDLLIS